MLNINGLLDKKVRIVNSRDGYSTQGTIVGAFLATICGGENELVYLVQHFTSNEISRFLQFLRNPILAGSAYRGASR